MLSTRLGATWVRLLIDTDAPTMVVKMDGRLADDPRLHDGSQLGRRRLGRIREQRLLAMRASRVVASRRERPSKGWFGRLGAIRVSDAWRQRLFSR